MKTHYGIMENFGDYESPIIGCEQTLCGYGGEEVCESATDNWDEVDCKKCLNLRERFIISEKVDEECIINQMGEMADFLKECE